MPLNDVIRAKNPIM